MKFGGSINQTFSNIVEILILFKLELYSSRCSLAIGIWHISVLFQHSDH